MCMMIWHPASAARDPFTLADFEDFHHRNPHGFGVIWRNPNPRPNPLCYAKGRFTPQETYAAYRQLLARGHTALALHWRLATAGARGDQNCHPFLVNRVLLMHNGVLDHRSTAKLSDTQCFIRDTLRDHLSPAHLKDARYLAWLNRHIGTGNKMLLWAPASAVPVIVGEEKGVWHAGKWFSNTYAWSAPAAARRTAAWWDDDATPTLNYGSK